MTLAQLNIEAAIKEAGDTNNVIISKEDAVYILDILKKYEIQNETVQLKEPSCCKECKSIGLIGGANWYCHMSAILPDNPQMDISTIYVNPEEKPSWCPISNTNDKLSKLNPKEKENVNMLIKGLSVLFGSENMLDATK